MLQSNPLWSILQQPALHTVLFTLLFCSFQRLPPRSFTGERELTGGGTRTPTTNALYSMKCRRHKYRIRCLGVQLRCETVNPWNLFAEAFLWKLWVGVLLLDYWLNFWFHSFFVQQWNWDVQPQHPADSWGEESPEGEESTKAQEEDDKEHPVADERWEDWADDCYQ